MQPEDFIVEEVLGFEPDGEGQHVLLQIRKRGANTEWLARQLARLADVKQRDVSYAGLKDRNAVTTQWFSIDLAGKPEPAWSQLESDDIQILMVARHRRKLRRGTLRSNRFTIVLRGLQGDRADLEQRLEAVQQQGVPNYFGEQRFGHGGNNIQFARNMFTGAMRVNDKHKRGLYLSAARSLLFNLVLARRVAEGSWNSSIPGDAMMLAGSHSFFACPEPDAAIMQRVSALDVHPSGPLWGRGRTPVTDQAAQLEDAVLADWEEFRTGLERAGLEQDRRALRLQAGDLGWQIGENTLALRFSLVAGGYATAVLRELVIAPPGRADE